MGSKIGWQCGDCGAHESFFYGGGMRAINEVEVVDLAKKGTYGLAMFKLLGSGIPRDWTVFRENAFYECPNCGGIISGGRLRIDDESGGWIVYYTEPDACESCGEKLVFWDDKEPMNDRELLRRCENYAEAGCPKCGGTNVSLSMGTWD